MSLNECPSPLNVYKCLMPLLLTRYVTTVLIIITVTLTLSLSCKPLLAPLSAFTVSSGAFCFCRLRRKPLFYTVSGVEHAQHNKDQFRFRRAAFHSQLKSKVGNILAKTTALCINLNIDDAPISSRTPLPLTNLSPPLHFPLFRHPLPPLHLECARLLLYPQA
jgi:hypothetical protein